MTINEKTKVATYTEEDFKRMTDDALMAWFIFFKLDGYAHPEPENIHDWIKEYHGVSRTGMEAFLAYQGFAV